MRELCSQLSRPLALKMFPIIAVKDIFTRTMCDPLPFPRCLNGCIVTNWMSSRNGQKNNLRFYTVHRGRRYIALSEGSTSIFLWWFKIWKQGLSLFWNLICQLIIDNFWDVLVSLRVAIYSHIKNQMMFPKYQKLIWRQKLLYQTRKRIEKQMKNAQ